MTPLKTTAWEATFFFTLLVTTWETNVFFSVCFIHVAKYSKDKN